MLNTSFSETNVLTGWSETLNIETWAGPDAGKLTFIELYTSVGVTDTTMGRKGFERQQEV